ncbi:MAG: sigma-54-dependent Fis family transcriptional regulator, partial [Granulosicoccaceae bacterium]
RNSATFIEGLYFLRLHRSDLIIHLGINPDIVPQPRNAMIAVTPSGQITGANERALLALGIPSRLNLLGRDISHLLDLRKQPLSARAAGQIHQIKLIDRGTQVFATWQVPAPISTESYDNRAPLSELSPLAKPEPDRLCWGDITLDEQVIAASKIYNQRVNVLLQGETGTGKDTLARELHDASCLKNGLFVTIDCSASSSDELSNLFTDSEERLNQSLYPEGGSLFLNNIHQLNSEGQSQALALLQRLERCSLDHKRGFQAISASRTCLYEAVEKQLFKEDLYYRLAPFVVDLAPLRDRDSLETLISKLLQAENTRAMHQCALSKPALEALAQHPWQGNTRELQNTLRTLVILNRNGTIEVSDLPKIMQLNAGTSAEQADKPCWTGLEAAEYSALLEALRDHNWNISATAKTLSMSRNTLYRRMEKYGIQVETSDMAGH